MSYEYKMTCGHPTASAFYGRCLREGCRGERVEVTRRTGPDPEDREPGRASTQERIPGTNLPAVEPGRTPESVLGARVVAASGAVKADGGKRRLDLLPVRPVLDVADVLTFGANKYEDRNWEAGFPYSRVYAAALRHQLAWWNGETDDEETGLNHLAHAVTNLMFLLEYAHTGAGEDDRP